MRFGTGRLRAPLLVVGFFLAGRLDATVALSPASAGLYPTQSVSVTATLSGLPILSSGTGTLTIAGLPSGVTTSPAVVTYAKFARLTTATAAFQIVAGAGAVAGASTLTVTDATFGGGSTTFALSVLEPQMRLSITTPTITLGSATVNVPVRVSVDPGFGANVGAGGVPLLFGVDVGAPPANVTAGGGQNEVAPYTNTLTFPFRRTGTVTPGTYAVNLAAVWTGTTRLPQSATATLTLNIPDISVIPPVLGTTVCNGGLVVTSQSYAFISVFGYAGTASTNVTSAPPGLTPVNPPKTITLAAGQTLQQTFQAQASGAPTGLQTLTFALQDAAAAVNKTYAVGFKVINPDVTATTTAPSISLQAGGASQAFVANTTAPPATCNAFHSVDYTITGLPAGFTLPGTVTVSNVVNSYPPANLPISAGAGVVPGSYPANVHFNVPATGQSGNVPVTVNVSAGPDFSLSGSPNPITIRQGQSGTVAISLAALNGFAGAANVTIPAIQSVTATPSTFRLVAGQPQNVVFAVAANAAPGTYTAAVTGSAAGVPGTRTVNVSIVVPPPPDFTLTSSAPTLTLSPGATGTLTFTVNALNGWNTPTLFGVPTIPNVSAVPAATSFPGTGGSIDVSFTASPSAPSGTTPATFTATVPATAGPPITRSVTVNIVIQPPPDFSLSVAPLNLAVFAGDTQPVTVTANPLYGFAGSVAVTAPSIPGFTFSPASFTLAAGAQQVVQVAVAAGAPSGATTAAFTGTAAGVAGPRTGRFTITVSPKPDFALQVTPSAVTIDANGAAKVTVFAQAINGFTGNVSVTAPVLPGITFNPATFTLPAGASQVVDLQGVAAPAGTATGAFTGTSGGATRTGALAVTVTGAPDFQVQLTPATLTLAPGASGTTAVSIVALNGLGGTFNLTVTPPPGLTITPTTFTLSPGGTQTLNVTAAAGASGLLSATVAGLSTQLGTTRTATLSVSVPVPDYVLSLSPSSLRLAPGGSSPVAVTATPLNGFAGIVTVVPALPAGVDADLKSFTLAPGETKLVTISLAAGGGAGFFSVPFTGTTPGGPTHAATLAISVETTPDFTLAVNPQVLTLSPGGKAPATVTLVPLNGWSGGVDVTATGSSGITVAPPAFPLQPGVPYPVEIRAATDTPAGAVTLLFRASGANGGAGVTVTRTVNVQVTVGTPDFNVRVAPAAPAVVAGRSADLTFTLEPIGGFAANVAVTPVTLPPGATLAPAQPVLSPNLPQAATLSIPRGTPPGSYTLVFRADEITSVRLVRRSLVSKTFSVPLTVTPASGGFTVTVSPTTVLAPPDGPVAVRYELRNLGDAPLTITGDTFTMRTTGGTALATVDEPLAVTLPPRGVQIVSNTVLVTGEQFAKAGSPPIVLADRLFRATPDDTGYTPTAGATVTVTAANSLLATASATRVSVVYPPSGTLVGRGDSLRAQGLVIGSGTGNLLVGWFYDGVLVETATVPLQNGTPTSVSNAVSLPTLVSGNHEIALAILAPNTLSSPPVQIYVEEGQRTLRLVSPTAGAVFPPALTAPTFSWIPVPGIARYGVGIRRRVPGAAWRWTYTTDTRWSPPAALWNALAEGDYEWGVRGFTNSGRVFLDSQSGGATAPPTSEGSLDMAEGWTVTSAQGRFSIGGADGALATLVGTVTVADGVLRFTWTETPGALYVHTVSLQAPDGVKRVRTEIVATPSLLIPAAALPRGGPLVWRVTAVDRSGRPLGATALAAVPAAGGAR